MPTPAGNEHLRQIGSEPRLLVHIGNLRFSDKGDTFLGVPYDPRIRSVSGINSEWAAGDLGVVSDITINFNDGDNFMLELSYIFQFERAGCAVYHYFVGEDDKVLIFSGTIVSPVSFSDQDKTFVLSVSNALAGTPLGFAPTKEDIPSIAEEAIGQTWPMVFGSPRRSKATLLSRPVIGRLKDDTPTNSRIIRIENGNAFAQDRPEKDENGFTPAPNPITLQLRIGDEIVQGHFEEDLFHIDQAVFSYKENSFMIANPGQVAHDGWNMDAYFDIPMLNMNQFIGVDGARFKDPDTRNVFIPKLDGQGREIDVLGMMAYFNNPDEPSEVWQWNKVVGFFYNNAYGDFQRLKFDKGWAIIFKTAGKLHFCARIRKGWTNRNEELFTHEAGTTVTVWKSQDPDALKTIYVANAFDTINVSDVYVNKSAKDSNSNADVSQLIRLNPTSYEIELKATDLDIKWPGGLKLDITPCLIKFLEPPVHLMDDPDDPLFVDIKSEVPESSADALKFLLEEWGGFDINEASFGNANEKTELTPSHFTLHDIIDVLEVSNDIAWQSRSVLIVKLGEIFMKYLPIASIADLVNIPASDLNLVEGSCRIVHTDMSDIITQFKITFSTTGARREEGNLVSATFSNNTDLYGITEEEHDMFIYDDFDFVQQTIEWWLKQKSFIWKEFHGQAFLDLMEIDPLDYVLVDSELFPASLRPQTARIDRLTFNPQDDSVSFEAWTGIPSGSSNFDPEIISDTIDLAALPGDILGDPLDVPPPFSRRVHKDQQQAGEDRRTDHGGVSHIVWARISNETPDQNGKYRCIVFEGGKPEEMDDDTKSTYYADDDNLREIPLTVIGLHRPSLDDHVQVAVTPIGYFYHAPRNRWT